LIFVNRRFWFAADRPELLWLTGDAMRFLLSKIVVGLIPILIFSFSSSVRADQVILDDLIVDGSACVGQDCVNGESFGFDTLRLKENNLRIKFQDTSTSASFPTNDWQLTANDTNNGGQNKFSIDDIDGGKTPFTIEAGAPSHSLYVDDGGRIGFGTSTPVVELHVKDGDSPTLRLEQDGSSGFTAQTWDVAGNETNFFVRDVTNGSKLPLRIRPSAPTNSIFVNTDGNIGLNTSSPTAPVHVKRTAGTGNLQMLLLENSNGSLMRYNNTANGQFWDVGMVNNGNFRLVFDTGGANTKIVEIFRATGNIATPGSFISNGTTLNVPDYVFEDDYQLMPLSEVKEFVSQQKHLPNVPSEKEIKENSLNLTEMQMRLLEKIEELTLYTIDQQQMIDDQQTTIHDLKTRLEKVEKTLD
jgi:hypothetical protein